MTYDLLPFTTGDRKMAQGRKKLTKKIPPPVSFPDKTPRYICPTYTGTHTVGPSFLLIPIFDFIRWL